MLSAVMLVGGRSTRFGGDKYLFPVGGVPVVRRVYEAVSEVADRVYISTYGPERYAELARHLDGEPLLDAGPCAGPMRGIHTASLALSGEVMFVPGDLPYLRGGTLRRLVDMARRWGAEVASPMWGNGHVEFLVTYMADVGLARQVCEARPAARPSALHRAAASLLLAGTARLTDNPIEFTNLNTPSDLAHPNLRGPPTTRTIHIYRGTRRLELLRGDRDLLAAERAAYTSLGLHGLAEHVEADIRRTQ